MKTWILDREQQHAFFAWIKERYGLETAVRVYCHISFIVLMASRKF